MALDRIGRGLSARDRIRSAGIGPDQIRWDRIGPDQLGSYWIGSAALRRQVERARGCAAAASAHTESQRAILTLLQRQPEQRQRAESELLCVLYCLRKEARERGDKAAAAQLAAQVADLQAKMAHSRPPAASRNPSAKRFVPQPETSPH